MTTPPNRPSLGTPKQLANLKEMEGTHLYEIDQVIGMAMTAAPKQIDESVLVEISINGKRWPSDGARFKDQTGGQPDGARIQSYITEVRNLGMPLVNDDLLDVQVQGQTLLFLTTNIDNLKFKDDVILRKPGSHSDFNLDPMFADDSVTISPDGQTVFWLSKQPWGQKDEGPKWYYDIHTKLEQSRNGHSMSLPIIIDPGTKNGGTGGWPQ